MLTGQRDRLVRQRTELANTICGHAAEFGSVAAKGAAVTRPLLERLREADIPTLARDVFAELAEEHAALRTRIAAIDRRLRDWHEANELSQRPRAIPGVGPLIASLAMTKPDGQAAAVPPRLGMAVSPSRRTTSGRQGPAPTSSELEPILVAEPGLLRRDRL